MKWPPFETEECLLAEPCLTTPEVKDRGEVRDGSQSTPQLRSPKSQPQSLAPSLWVPYKPGCRSLRQWSGNQQAHQFSRKPTAESWKPLPKANTCTLHLASISAKGRGRRLHPKFVHWVYLWPKCTESLQPNKTVIH